MFNFYHVMQPFGPAGPFSTVYLPLDQVVLEDTEQVVAFNSLFSLGVKDFREFKQSSNPNPDENQVVKNRAMKQLLDNLEDPSQLLREDPFQSRQTEKMEFYVTATTLLQALCTEVTLDKYAYNGFVESLNPDKISVSHLGIGDALRTWHGTPDALCRAEGGSLTHVITSGDAASHESPGDSFIVEAKRLQAGPLFNNFGMQFSAETIISSFIEHNLHPDLNAMVPSVLINSRNFVIALYDVISDMLLVSEEAQWRDDLHIIPSGVMMLWAVFHHRLYLKKISTSGTQLQSGIKQHLQDIKWLQNFEGLRRKDQHWPKHPPAGHKRLRQEVQLQSDNPPPFPPSVKRARRTGYSGDSSATSTSSV